MNSLSELSVFKYMEWILSLRIPQFDQNAKMRFQIYLAKSRS